MNINIDSARDTLCKNILIYGYCKYENKGCVFNHNKGAVTSGTAPTAAGSASSLALAPGAPTTAGGAAPSASTGTSTPGVDTRKRFNFNTPSFQPSSIPLASTSPAPPGNNPATGIAASSNSSKYISSPKLKEIPTFVPEGMAPNDGVAKKFNPSTASFTPSFVPGSSQEHIIQSHQPGIPGADIDGSGKGNGVMHGPGGLSGGITGGVPGLGHSPGPGQGGPGQVTGILQHGQGSSPLSGPGQGQVQGQITGIHGPGGLGGPLSGQGPQGAPSNYGNPYSAPPSSSDLFFQHQPAARAYPLQYHLYAPAPPPRLTIPLPPSETNSQQLFILNELRETLTKKNEATLQLFPRTSHLPEHVNNYHSLYPLDLSTTGLKSKLFGVPLTHFKVFSNNDGNPYTLTKVENFSVIRIQNELPFKSIKKWKSITSANVVKLQESFTSMAFGGKNSVLVMIYDYYPNALTLLEHHINRKLGGKLEPLNEEILTAYIIQITSALIQIHDKGLAARSSLDINKIIVTSKNRIKLSCVGISDILSYENDQKEIDSTSLTSHTSNLQAEDLKKFGKLVLDLSLLCIPPQLRDQGINGLKGVFTQEYITILGAIFNVNSIQEFNQTYLSHKLIDFINSAQDGQDFMELQLTSELENARLFRLLTKIDFIVDKNLNNAGDNGPNYIIRLFRDYVFNEVNEFGKPTLNLSRVLTCLNKLDAGIEEKILLVSEDEKSCIIVSYKEVKELVGGAFRSLMR